MQQRTTTLLFLFLFPLVLSAQVVNKRVSTKGEAFGTCIEEVRTKALRDARAKALAKVGIAVSVNSVNLQQSSDEQEIIRDFFSQMVDENTTGLITKEEVLSESLELQRSKNLLHASVSLRATVKKQKGDIDPYFTIQIASDKNIISSGEAVQLKINPSKTGYLTLLAIQGSRVVRIFPNAVQSNNKIEANTTYTYPSMRVYDYRIFNPSPQPYLEEVIAIITKKEMPIAEEERVERHGGQLVLKEFSLTELAQWLFRIPSYDRASGKLSILVNPSKKD